MGKLREVIRLCATERNQREIYASTGISKGSVSDYLQSAVVTGLDWDAACALTHAGLETPLFKAVGRNEPPSEPRST